MGRREAAQPIRGEAGRHKRLSLSTSARRCVSLARSYVPRPCRGNGVQLGLEANVVALLPVSAGDGSLHAGALGADGVQYPLLALFIVVPGREIPGSVGNVPVKPNAGCRGRFGLGRAGGWEWVAVEGLENLL